MCILAVRIEVVKRERVINRRYLGGFGGFFHRMFTGWGFGVKF
jgi:hypothetical protein